MRLDAFHTVCVKWPPPSRSPSRYAWISSADTHSSNAFPTSYVKSGFVLGGIVHHVYAFSP